MIDWTKPVQVLSSHEWVPATVLKVHGDGSVVVEWRASPTPTPTLNADVFNDDDADEFVRNTPLKPRAFWVVLSGHGKVYDAYDSMQRAEKSVHWLQGSGSFPPYRIIHAIEVLP